MPKRALIEHRPYLLASLASAVAFYFLSDNPIGGVWLILLKGAGVGLLALYALRRAPGLDGKLIAGVMAFSAIADMVLEIDFELGGILFVLSHLIAVTLYARNRRESTSASQKGLAVALLIGTPLIAWFLSSATLIVIYAAWLGVMAASAWISRFPRYRVGIGAVLFIISDWLIFSRIGPFDLSPLPDLLVWPLYYAGQVMIVTGVVQTLRGETPAR